MDPDLRKLAIRLLDEHRIMTIATNRPDGWPQATIVGYANEGLTLYCFVARTSQKYANIKRDKRVSIAIANDFSDPMQIKGLSLAATATFVEDKKEFDRGYDLFLTRYPEYRAWPRPEPAMAPMLRFVPEVISVLDYSKGFGHSDLVTLASPNVDHVPSYSNWFETVFI